MMDAKRIVPLHPGSDRPGAEFVLYWMQIQRGATANDALNLAVEQANRRGLPKIVEWSPSPAPAQSAMTHHNDNGLDGRDPNSSTGFIRCFGLPDRAGEERAVFGKIRYMSSDATCRKTDAAGHLAAVAALGREREEAAS